MKKGIATTARRIKTPVSKALSLTPCFSWVPAPNAPDQNYFNSFERGNQLQTQSGFKLLFFKFTVHVLISASLETIISASPHLQLKIECLLPLNSRHKWQILLRRKWAVRPVHAHWFYFLQSGLPIPSWF